MVFRPDPSTEAKEDTDVSDTEDEMALAEEELIRGMVFTASEAEEDVEDIP